MYACLRTERDDDDDRIGCCLVQFLYEYGLSFYTLACAASVAKQQKQPVCVYVLHYMCVCTPYTCVVWCIHKLFLLGWMCYGFHVAEFDSRVQKDMKNLIYSQKM